MGRVKQQDPTAGPRTTIMSSKLQPYSVTIAFTVAIATPNKVPFQPGKWGKKKTREVKNVELQLLLCLSEKLTAVVYVFKVQV